MVAVFLSTFETQGIALAEAWSMNVPTVVWDPRGDAEWLGRRFTSASSAPYLTPATGVAFGDIGDLKPALDRALQSLGSFQPRDWVLEHMTDAVCSKRLYELIKEEAGRAGRAGTGGRARKRLDESVPIRTRTGTGFSAPEDAAGEPESGGDDR